MASCRLPGVPDKPSELGFWGSASRPERGCSAPPAPRIVCGCGLRSQRRPRQGRPVPRPPSEQVPGFAAGPAATQRRADVTVVSRRFIAASGDGDHGVQVTESAAEAFAVAAAVAVRSPGIAFCTGWHVAEHRLAGSTSSSSEERSRSAPVREVVPASSIVPPGTTAHLPGSSSTNHSMASTVVKMQEPAPSTSVRPQCGTA